MTFLILVFRLIVRLGEYNLSTDIDCQTLTNSNRICNYEGPVDRHIKKAIIHDNYRNLNEHSSDDIALIRLSSPVKYTCKHIPNTSF